MQAFTRVLLTGSVVLLAVGVVLFKYWHYVTNPWTRNGQVRANVIQITPRVSGPIVDLPIKDNQPVKSGDLLFEIDPRTFEATVEQARAALSNTENNVNALEKQVEVERANIELASAELKQAEIVIHQSEANIEKSEAEYERQQRLIKEGATSQRMVARAKANHEINLDERRRSMAGLLESQASLNQAVARFSKAQADLGATGDDNAQIRAAKASVQQAELNLEFTKVRAPVDGYVTNLKLRLGSQAVANQPALALVDINSYWIDGFFKENSIGRMRKGNRAVVTLMGYPDRPLQGRVNSIGWGIAQDDGSTGYDLLPNISPTFEWIRLAQRVPVRVQLDTVPDDVELRVGTTASVLVIPGDTQSQGDGVAPAPKALQ
jgi:multidrug resistance efflux pump